VVEPHVQQESEAPKYVVAGDQVMETVRLTAAEFDIAAKRLLARYGREISHRLEAFIAGRRYYCTGNLAWRWVIIALIAQVYKADYKRRRMSTGRYGVHQELRTDRITISLAVDDDEQ
jgi:hypothetical protein